MTGFGMWREYCATYGEQEARRICNSYLDLSIDPEKEPGEMEFRRQLYKAMQQ